MDEKALKAHGDQMGNGITDAALSMVTSFISPKGASGPTCPLADDLYNGWREVANSVSALLRVMDVALPASICMLLQNLQRESERAAPTISGTRQVGF